MVQLYLLPVKNEQFLIVGIFNLPPQSSPLTGLKQVPSPSLSPHFSVGKNRDVCSLRLSLHLSSEAFRHLITVFLCCCMGASSRYPSSIAVQSNSPAVLQPCSLLSCKPSPHCHSWKPQQKTWMPVKVCQMCFKITICAGGWESASPHNDPFINCYGSNTNISRSRTLSIWLPQFIDRPADNLKQTAVIQAEELRHFYCSTRTEMLEKLTGLIYWVE